MSRNSNKKPTFKEMVAAEKRPRANLPVPQEGQIRFSFSRFDGQIEWCKRQEYDSGSYLHVVANKLRDYESMKWNEINVRDHSVPFHRLIKEAQKRLADLELDEWDPLYRLRFTAKQRIWGIKHNDCFYALWWDPLHRVCPSTKKNT